MTDQKPRNQTVAGRAKSFMEQIRSGQNKGTQRPEQPAHR